MSSYSYHLKLELYPSPDPSAIDSTAGTRENEPIWQSANGSIFETLPSHPRRAPPTRTNPSRYLEEFIPLEDRRTVHQNQSGVIDCGTSRVESGDGDSSRQRSTSLLLPPGFAAGIGPRNAVKDWRFGRVNIESFDMVDGKESGSSSYFNNMADSEDDSHAGPAASLGPNLGGPGQATKGKFVPLETKNTEAGWGIVHLYRETNDSNASSSATTSGATHDECLNGDDGTILCIPSVPSYFTPNAFLSFVGRKWVGDVSHYRMVMTSSMSRYMVLMKLRDTKIAEAWRQEFDGKAFDTMETETCHVTFIKSITVEHPSQPKATSSKAAAGSINSLRPFPPPTPNLVELPTCTVCLERMDDTVGLITIPCQHVFHCDCLQTWKGSGCPVCRATNPTPTTPDSDDLYSRPFGNNISNLCSVCDTPDDLWICLLCGNVGCGRYKGGHAKEHWKETAHTFSLELDTQHVWDYAGDIWVHRLIREKGEGKVVEFPSADPAGRNAPNSQGGPDQDVVPRSKMENMGLEYTNLLTSQLETQRVYFEEMVHKAVDKATKASAAAETASAQAQEALSKLRILEDETQTLKNDTIPELERDLARERKKAEKSADMARNFHKSSQEEKKINEGLMEKLKHVNKEMEIIKTQNEALKGEVTNLKDENHDLTMFISGQQKLKEMEEEGKITQEDLDGGEASVPEKRRKGKGKGKK